MALKSSGGRALGAAAVGYAFGLAPCALLIGQLHGVDPRHEGERNPGAWNMWNLAGARAGVTTLLLDAGKGALAAGVGLRLSGWWGGLAGSLGAMAGHAWPVWLGFRHGGRSVSVLVGAAPLLAPRPALIAWTVCLGSLPFVSPRGSVSAGLLTYPLAFGLLGPERHRLVGIGLAYLVIALRSRPSG